MFVQNETSMKGDELRFTSTFPNLRRPINCLNFPTTQTSYNVLVAVSFNSLFMRKKHCAIDKKIKKYVGLCLINNNNLRLQMPYTRTIGKRSHKLC